MAITGLTRFSSQDQKGGDEYGSGYVIDASDRLDLVRCCDDRDVETGKPT